MKVLELTGPVEAGEDDWDEHWFVGDLGGPKIGGRSVIAAIEEVWGWMPSQLTVTALLAHGGDKELYEGVLYACEGDTGYSSLTPGSSPDLTLYPAGAESVDLIKKLRALDGEVVHLRLDDSP